MTDKLEVKLDKENFESVELLAYECTYENCNERFTERDEAVSHIQSPHVVKNTDKGFSLCPKEVLVKITARIKEVDEE